CTKYPPSLLFLLMTLGPAITFLAVADRVPRALARPLVVFGRVPLFYYLMHFLLIYLITRALALATYGSAAGGGEPRPHGHSPPRHVRSQPADADPAVRRGLPGPLPAVPLVRGADAAAPVWPAQLPVTRRLIRASGGRSPPGGRPTPSPPSGACAGRGRLSS